ncbi:MAG TPA: carboxypeptidase regulatory-like domain-containing protein [Candidatus Angelobacter sp.]|nr:carboxypeptidase regulatory-like domain-containing protein [Candidatus Angelobacter sp.]
MKFWPSGLRVWVLLISGVAIFAASAFAQGPTSRLQGTIMDPTGAVIPEAAIALKNSSGLVVAGKSNGLGEYDFRNLAPGKYTVSVTASGFVPMTQAVEIIAGQLTRADLTLKILVKDQNIDVQSDAAKVSTSSDNNASSVVISGKDLDALSDDPDELQSELQALAGPSAGPNGGQIYIDGFTGGQLPPKSSIREIRINQNPFSAQYDRMGFGRIEILTKPGTDKLHGQFMFNDNHSFFDALNPFAATEPDFSTQMTSGNVGGPLGKKMSYQINVERRDINEATVVLPAAFAAANLPVQGVLNPRVRTNFSSRFDYQVAASNTLMVRYQFTHDRQENNGVGQLALPSQAFNQTGSENEIQVSDTQILSAHAINETRFEWERGATDQNSLFLAPTINVLGQFTEGGNPLGNSSVVTNHYELQNYTSINRGNHFMRFGGRLRATSNSSLSTQNFKGTYTFDSLAAFQAGTPRQLIIVNGNPLTEDTFVDAGLYAEEDWKLHPNMTLSYGLRFETQNGINDHGDWAPRVGFAWGIGGKKNAAPKTVVRTGFGIFYDRFSQNLIMQAQRLNGVNQKQFIIKNPSYPTLPSLASLAGTPATSWTIDPNLRAPYTIQAAGSVERQIGKVATLTETYVHSHGVHQLFANVVSTVPAPQYQFESDGVFNQNQLITSFNVRAGTRLTIFSFYMFSHANSDSFGATSFASDPARGIKADYGRASFDVHHRLFFGGTVALPHGFRVSPFMVANSGAPFNITIGRDINNDSVFNDRPAFATDLSRASVVETSFGAFDTAPIPGQTIIPVNFGTSPAQFTLNMRLSKTFGLGPKLDSGNNNQNPQQQAGQRGPGGAAGGAHPPAGGGRPGGDAGHGPGGGGPGMGGGPRGMGGPFGGPEKSNQRYSLTFSANARNLFNNVNPAPPIGNLSSGLFGKSTALAGGVFNTQSANRRIDLQVMFSF